MVSQTAQAFLPAYETPPTLAAGADTDNAAVERRRRWRAASNRLAIRLSLIGGTAALGAAAVALALTTGLSGCLTNDAVVRSSLGNLGPTLGGGLLLGGCVAACEGVLLARRQVHPSDRPHVDWWWLRAKPP